MPGICFNNSGLTALTGRRSLPILVTVLLLSSLLLLLLLLWGFFFLLLFGDLFFFWGGGGVVVVYLVLFLSLPNIPAVGEVSVREGSTVIIV